MTTFARLQQQTHRFVKKLVEHCDLDYKLVANIVQYARCLPKRGSTDIDENIFVAQMAQHFNLTSAYMLSLMFNALKGEKGTTVTIEAYCKCICTFMSNNLDLKIDFVFQVYDANMDGCLSYLELYTFLKPCILHHENEELDTEESLRELIDLVIFNSDRDGNNEIDLEEFRRLVKKDILYIQLLGPCLPNESALLKFKQRLVGRSPFDVRKEFEYERSRSLGEFMPSGVNGLYPVKLHIP